MLTLSYSVHRSLLFDAYFLRFSALKIIIFCTLFLGCSPILFGVILITIMQLVKLIKGKLHRIRPPPPPSRTKNVCFCWCLLRIELESKESRQESSQCSDREVTFTWSCGTSETKQLKAEAIPCLDILSFLDNEIRTSTQWNPCKKDKINVWLWEAHKNNENEAPNKQSTDQSYATR